VQALQSFPVNGPERLHFLQQKIAISGQRDADYSPEGPVERRKAEYAAEEQGCDRECSKL